MIAPDYGFGAALRLQFQKKTLFASEEVIFALYFIELIEFDQFDQKLEDFQSKLIVALRVSL